MSSRKDALSNDALIQDLVIYELTKGNTKTLQKEDLDKLQDRFAEYKGLIRRGEFTYDEMADKIFGKYGILNPLVSIPVQDPYAQMAPLPPPSDKDLSDFLTFVKDVVKEKEPEKQEKPMKPVKWYSKIWNAICVALSRLNVNI